MDYIAHKRDDNKEQTVKEHLFGTAELAAKFASDFDAEEQGRLVGLAHDIGKYSKKFQDRILKNGPKVDHSTAGAYVCALNGQNYASFCVAGHHSGLPDFGAPDDDNEGTLRARINRAVQGRLPDYSVWKEEIGDLPNAKMPVFSENNNLGCAFFIRMLFSCLVDADFLDTENFMSSGSVNRSCDVSMEYLERKIDEYISNWFPPKGELNKKRCEILSSCMEKHSLKPGFFTLTVPTGGGKTIASLAFAVKHAKEHGLKRIIYVIPYTSIIEQTSEIFRNIIGEECVLEHHSNVEYNSEENITEEDMKMNLATENWDMPVIVTTAVQFFESLFANKSSKCRKLHNIAKSVIVFDEAQMLPIPYLKPCVYAISQLVKYYRVSAVLCTATQPSLRNIIEEFYGKCNPVELCPAELREDNIFKRTKYENMGIVSWDEVSDCMMKQNQILCIVNSRKSAFELYSRIEKEGGFHLSTLMVPAERKRILKIIRERLKAGKICRVVSTSLIEAGVDVDFPLVMREEAGLDSILQAGGRCNREGRRPLKESTVTIFKSEDKTPKLFEPNISAGRMAMEDEKDISSERSIKKYFDILYKIKGSERLDAKGITKLLAGEEFAFKKVAELFKMIDTDTAMVYIPIGEGKKIVEKRKYGEVSRQLLRQLGQYGVNIYKNHLQALYEAGDIEKINDSEWVLCNTDLYDDNTGLSLEADTGKALFI